MQEQKKAKENKPSSIQTSRQIARKNAYKRALASIIRGEAADPNDYRLAAEALAQKPSYEEASLAGVGKRKVVAYSKQGKRTKSRKEEGFRFSNPIGQMFL